MRSRQDDDDSAKIVEPANTENIIKFSVSRGLLLIFLIVNLSGTIALVSSIAKAANPWRIEHQLVFKKSQIQGGSGLEYLVNRLDKVEVGTDAVVESGFTYEVQVHSYDIICDIDTFPGGPKGCRNTNQKTVSNYFKSCHIWQEQKVVAPSALSTNLLPTGGKVVHVACFRKASDSEASFQLLFAAGPGGEAYSLSGTAILKNYYSPDLYSGFSMAQCGDSATGVGVELMALDLGALRSGRFDMAVHSAQSAAVRVRKLSWKRGSFPNKPVIDRIYSDIKYNSCTYKSNHAQKTVEINCQSASGVQKLVYSQDQCYFYLFADSACKDCSKL